VAGTIGIRIEGKAFPLVGAGVADCGFRFDPATHSKSYPATIPIIIRPAFRPLSGHLF
jgi:hypothetical protein